MNKQHTSFSHYVEVFVDVLQIYWIIDISWRLIYSFHEIPLFFPINVFRTQSGTCIVIWQMSLKSSQFCHYTSMVTVHCSDTLFSYDVINIYYLIMLISITLQKSHEKYLLFYVYQYQYVYVIQITQNSIFMKNESIPLISRGWGYKLSLSGSINFYIRFADGLVPLPTSQNWQVTVCLCCLASFNN